MPVRMLMQEYLAPLGAVMALAVLLTGCYRSGTPEVKTLVNADPPSTKTAGQGTEIDEAATTGTPSEGTNDSGTKKPGEKSTADEKKKSTGSKTGSPDPDPSDLQPPGPVFPYQVRHEVPEFPTDREWLNTGRPITLRECRGKFVIIDFWTYCCINCMHILPELKKLEHAYPNNVVVIGVHSAKFDTEQETKNIRDAILRYEIEHPVVNDHDHRIWDAFGISSWPSLMVLDPEGRMVGRQSGEIKFEELEAFLLQGMGYYREKGLLNEQPLRLTTEAAAYRAGPLKFPGKIFAHAASDSLFVSDTGHNRIVLASLAGKVREIIGSGVNGKTDGDFASASFNRPQGVFLHGQTLYVADTENHLLRKVDLVAKTVSTIAGLGEQARSAWPGLEKVKRLADVPDRWVGKPLETGLNSPWALWVQGEALYIAMAGPHQIWKMPLDESEIGPYSGNGREDIVDGLLLPREPYQQGYASFAQPSGLASDGQWLYVADSEGSSIRAVPFTANEEVRTVLGTAQLPQGRLFTFGDVDGAANVARLQHPLDVAHAEGKLYVADTYNNKIRVLDAKTGAAATLAGTGKPGRDDKPPAFDEPEGVSLAQGKLYVADTNNHAVRVIDLTRGNAVSTLTLEGLSPPANKSPAPVAAKKPSFSGAAQVKLEAVKLAPQAGRVKLVVSLALPVGWKINPLGPAGYAVERLGDSGVVAASAFEKFEKIEPKAEFNIMLPVTGTGSDALKVGVVYYYCEEKESGVCKTGSVQFTVPLQVDAAGQETGKLTFMVPE